ncbi:hypothetical protein ACF1BQ_038985 [Bradyrhizobium sp. RDT10]
MLIADGADVNQHIYSRWPPGSLSEPDQRCPLSALYGAAGSNHDPVLTKLLLKSGADPNDGRIALSLAGRIRHARACFWTTAPALPRAMRSIARSTSRTTPR